MVNLANTLVATFLHNLKHNVRFLRFWDFDSVEFLVVQENPVLIGLLAHLTAKFLPI